MQRAYLYYKNLSKRTRDSFQIAVTSVGIISTVMTVIGVSIGDWISSLWISILIVIFLILIVFIITYITIGRIFKDEVKINIRQTSVCIMRGDIFKVSGWKVIGCDSHFDLRIDDTVISKKSVHGKFVMEHAKIVDLINTIHTEANRRKLHKDESGLYTFPLGTIIPYVSSIDNEKYLLLATDNLNEQYEARTNMEEYEQMLMKMWREIDRVYSMNDIVLPLLGTGLLRFENGPKDKNTLLRCMLCTLNSSGISVNEKIKIII